jgi:zinc transport system ATP-binding protein
MQIEIEELSFSYDANVILEKIDLHIGQGEFIGIIGPNGGGKTTLLKLLMGFLRPSKGRVVLRGKVGYVPQINRTDRDFPITVHELIMLGGLSEISFWGAYPEEIKEKAMGLIKLLGLDAHKEKIFGSLSGGLAQKALLARALLSDPDILILDEPTANIDPASSAAILELLESLKRKKTILMVTHDLKTIIERVDRVLCVEKEITSLLPQDVCKHFAFGLYHTPLLAVPPLKEKEYGLPIHR